MIIFFVRSQQFQFSNKIQQYVHGYIYLAQRFHNHTPGWIILYHDNGGPSMLWSEVSSGAGSSPSVESMISPPSVESGGLLTLCTGISWSLALCTGISWSLALCTGISWSLSSSSPRGNTSDPLSYSNSSSSVTCQEFPSTKSANLWKWSWCNEWHAEKIWDLLTEHNNFTLKINLKMKVKGFVQHTKCKLMPVLILLGRKYTTGSNQLQFIKTLIKIISYQIFTIFNNFISNLYHLYKISVHLLAMSFVSICI